LRILLVEDNAINQRVAVRLLEKQGHSVATAANGRLAVEMTAAERFDLVLMDVQMPEMDGLEATRTIRGRERRSGGHLPILAMTAHALKGDAERCIAAGMDGYVSKPARPADLAAAIEKVFAQPSIPSKSR
jgi:CheY-like chemotaxis protein